MRKYLSILFIFLSLSATATNWYVYEGGTSGSGTIANPWTLAQHNATSSVVAGDSVSFNRGGVYGYLITAAGSSGNPVRYGTYGTGSNPKFSGMTTVTSWTQVGGSGNIWYATLNMAGTILRMVTIDGRRYGMGKYPNDTTLLRLENYSGTTSITDNQLTGTPNWTGAEVVIHKYVRWIWDRHYINSHSGSTINYNSTTWPFGSSPYGLDDGAGSTGKGNGYFIQNHYGTLDLDGEWYDSVSVNRLYIYSTTDPNSRVVKASTISTPVNYLHSYTTMNNLDFEGGEVAIDAQGGQGNITLYNCNFTFQGNAAFFGQNCTNITFSNCTVTDCNNIGAVVVGGGNGMQFLGCTFHNIGDIVGMSGNSDGAGRAISIFGSGTIVRYCTTRNTGFAGIWFYGRNNFIEYNVVDSFCVVNDDNGGIYNYAETPTDTFSNNNIRYNFISNGLGVFRGLEAAYAYEPWGLAHGVYLDGYTNHATVVGNTISNCDAAGIMENGNKDNTITDNTIFNTRFAIMFMAYDTGRIRNLILKRNLFIAKLGYQKAAYLRRATNLESVSAFGTIDSNYYAKPLFSDTTMEVDDRVGNTDEVISLATWKSRYSPADAASLVSQKTASSVFDFKFDTNPTASAVTVQLGNTTYKDVKGNLYSTSYSLPAYESRVLIFNTILPSGSTIKTIGGKVATKDGKIIK